MFLYQKFQTNSHYLASAFAVVLLTLSASGCAQKKEAQIETVPPKATQAAIELPIH